MFHHPSLEHLRPVRGIKLFLCDLNIAKDSFDELKSFLSPGELSRASKFGKEDLCCEFILRRGMLRSILSDVTKLLPKDIVFTYGPFGKPSLATILGTDLPEFNCARSNSFALYAIGGSEPVGVDLEYFHPEFSFDGLIRDHFTNKEQQILHSMNFSQASETFFQWWTRKEACAKALGVGLSRPMSGYEVADLNGWPQDSNMRGLDVLIGGAFKAAICTLRDSLISGIDSSVE